MCKMAKRSKSHVGFKKSSDFSVSDRHRIIQEMMLTGSNKQEIWEKYTGQPEEHGRVLRWMRELGYHGRHSEIRATFLGNSIPMKNSPSSAAAAGDSEETLQLKKKIRELESQLNDAEMKAIAFSTLIDIAEKEFSIPIRKKATTKPLKQ